MILRILLAWVALIGIANAAESNFRPFKNEADQQAWLSNMVVHHRFDAEELRTATGLPLQNAESLVREFR